MYEISLGGCASQDVGSGNDCMRCKIFRSHEPNCIMPVPLYAVIRIALIVSAGDKAVNAPHGDRMRACMLISAGVHRLSPAMAQTEHTQVMCMVDQQQYFEEMVS